MKEINVPMGDGSELKISVNDLGDGTYNGAFNRVTVSISFTCNNRSKPVCGVDCTHVTGYMRNDMSVTTYVHRDGKVHTSTVRPFVQHYIDIMEDREGGFMLRIIDSSTDQPVDMFCDSRFPTVELAKKMQDSIIQQNPEIVWTIGVE